MSNKIIVYKNRTNAITIGLGVDVSSDTFTSQIRSEPTVEAPLIAEWDVSFRYDGSDGELVLTLDDLITSQITVNQGYMDLKRSSGGEPYAVFEKPLEVVFVGSVTA